VNRPTGNKYSERSAKFSQTALVRGKRSAGRGAREIGVKGAADISEEVTGTMTATE
jgi:hypothetical protein